MWPALALFSSLMAAATSVGATPPVPASYGDAMRWYVRAAEAGDACAQFLLALRYHDGVGVARDLENARVWFGRAAEQHHPEAQFKFGVMLEMGVGGAADLKSAAKWYAAAAGEGYAPAQHNLGVAYLNATGVEHDPVTALAWLSIAARAGMADSAALMDEMRRELPEADIIEAARLADALAPATP